MRTSRTSASPVLTGRILQDCDLHSLKGGHAESVAEALDNENYGDADDKAELAWLRHYEATHETMAFDDFQKAFNTHNKIGKE